jgi:hypothetical protein
MKEPTPSASAPIPGPADIPPASVKAWRAGLLAVFLVALFVRVTFVLESHAYVDHRVFAPGLDAHVTWEAARFLRGAVTGEGAFEVRMLSAPLHPLTVALQQELLGESVLPHRLLGALLSSLRFVLLALVLARVVGAGWAALVGSLLAAALPSVIVFDTILMKPGLDLTLATLLVWAVLRVGTLSGRGALVRGGLLVGGVLTLAFSCQLNTFLYLVPVVGFSVLNPGWTREQRVSFLVPAVGLFLVSFVGLQVAQRTILRPAFEPRAGFDIRIAYHEGAGVSYVRTLGVPGMPFGQAFVSRLVAEAEAGRELTPAEASAHHTARAGSFIRQHPLKAASLVAQRVLAFFQNPELRGEIDIPWEVNRSAVLSALPLGFGVFTVLAPFGVFALARRREWARLSLLVGLVGAVLAATCITYVTNRFRLPAVVPLAVLSGAGLPLLAELARGGAARLGGALAAGATLAVIAFGSASSGQAEGMMRRAEAAAKASATAVERTEELARLEQSGLSTVEARLQRARLLGQLQRHTESYAALTALVHEGVHELWVHESYLEYLLWLGDHAGVVAHLARLRREDPAVYEKLVTGYIQSPIGGQRAIVARVMKALVLPKLRDAT